MRAARILPLILLSACGRIAFDGVGSAGDGGQGGLDAADDANGADSTLLPDIIPPDTPGPTDFVVYWPFEVQGAAGMQGIWPDYTETREALCTQPDCPGSGAGKYDFGCSMSGGDRLVIPSESRLQSGNAFTVSFWFYLFGPTVPAGGSCLVSKLVGTDIANSWQVCVTDANELSFYSSPDGVTNVLVGTLSVTLDAWHHVAIVWDGSSKRMRLDGNLGASTGGTMTAFDSGDILLGFDIDSGTPIEFLAGTLDDLKIYDRALTLDELNALAEN